MNAPRFAYRADANGERVSTVRGWTVTYPSMCNGRLADMAFLASPGYRSDFIHYSPSDGHAYGMPAPLAVLARAERMRAAFLPELLARRAADADAARLTRAAERAALLADTHDTTDKD